MTTEWSAMPLVHPAAIVRGLWEYDHVQVHNLERAREFVEHGHHTQPAYPEPILFPTLDELRTFLVGPVDDGVAIDIETAGAYIICVGLTRLADLAHVACRFLTRGGTLYWNPWTDFYTATELLYDFLASPVPKWFHNGQAFDVPHLESLGFTVAEPILDTMLAHKTALAGLPAGLQFCATYHLGMPVWKDMVNEDEEVQGK